MDLALLWRGLLLGFSIAAPVGPIGVLVIRHSITNGRGAGLRTGLGAAVADGLYGLAGGLGISAVSTLLVHHALWLRIGGGAFLIWLGIRTIAGSPESAGRETTRSGPTRTFLTGLVLTLSNPLTMLSFAAMFAGLGVGVAGTGGASVGWLVAGVFGGSALWWLILSTAASLARSRMTPARLRWVNRASGVIIAAFGVAAWVSAR